MSLTIALRVRNLDDFVDRPGLVKTELPIEPDGRLVLAWSYFQGRPRSKPTRWKAIEGLTHQRLARPATTVIGHDAQVLHGPHSIAIDDSLDGAAEFVFTIGITGGRNQPGYLGQKTRLPGESRASIALSPDHRPSKGTRWRRSRCGS